MLRGFKTTFKRQSSIAASNKNKDNIKLFLYLNFRVVMRRSRCRPWLDCGRCVRSLRTRIYRRSTRLMDKSQRLINLNTQAQAQIQNEYKSQQFNSMFQSLLSELQDSTEYNKEPLYNVQSSVQHQPYKSKPRSCHHPTPK